MANQSVIEDHEHYTIEITDDRQTMLFNWKHIPGLSIAEMGGGISVFAAQCRDHKPVLAVINAQWLDPTSPGLGWVSGQARLEGQEAYDPWWIREIVPMYHQAGIAGLGVATGDPNAPGEIPETPPGVDFKMGYFPDLESALRWKLT